MDIEKGLSVMDRIRINKSLTQIVTQVAERGNLPDRVYGIVFDAPFKGFFGIETKIKYDSDSFLVIPNAKFNWSPYIENLIKLIANFAGKENTPLVCSNSVFEKIPETDIWWMQRTQNFGYGLVAHKSGALEIYTA